MKKSEIKNWKIENFNIKSTLKYLIKTSFREKISIAIIICLFLNLKFLIFSDIWYIIAACFITLMFSIERKNKIFASDKKNKDILKNLLTYTPDLIYYKNLDPEISGCNENFCEFFGMSLDEIIGKTINDFFSKEDTKVILEKEHYVANSLKTLQYELVLKSERDQKEHYMEVTKSPVCDSFNNVIGFSTICHDITDFKLKEKEKRFLNAALTHDLKNPILAQIKVLEIITSNKCKLSDKARTKMLEQTLYSAKLVYEMIDSILYLSKFEMSTYKFKPEDFDIRETILLILDKIKDIAETKNLKINLNYNKLYNSRIYGDKILLRRAIFSLIFNSITCSIENSELDVFLVNNNNNLKFWVRNKTVKSNMTKEKLEEIYNKYILSEEKFRQIGSGIGMYFSKQIILQHNGNIYADIIKTTNNDYDFFEFGFELNSVVQQNTIAAVF